MSEPCPLFRTFDAWIHTDPNCSSADFLGHLDVVPGESPNTTSRARRHARMTQHTILDDALGERARERSRVKGCPDVVDANGERPLQKFRCDPLAPFVFGMRLGHF